MLWTVVMDFGEDDADAYICLGYLVGRVSRILDMSFDVWPTDALD